MALPEILRDNLALPAVAAPLFLCSGPELVIAQCSAGVVGSFPALNARPAPAVREWLEQITTALDARRRDHPDLVTAPFAVNQIVHKSNARLDEDVQACIDFEVPIVITSLGARADVNDAIHSYGGIVLHDVINDTFARKAIDKGADGLIAVAAGAGGHAGTISPFALVQEIRAWFDGPLLLSGAIGHGRSILAAQAAGADLAYIGSAFLATTEARTEAAYKDMIAASGASDIVYSNLFTGVHGNYLRGSIEAAGLDPDNLPQSDPSTMDFGSGGNTDAKAWKDIWGAGQGIGAIREVVSTAELVSRLSEEYTAARTRLIAEELTAV
ncbi:nitronate monooxygenase family protein [Mycobacterium sp. PSTR-4-N]|uniref:NAD(P)H-dependent flavin oxidoreductase n=1 Tax=Mycobacterium sp. PSTR-4-N TaxID=2917745 RepID=UPI001F150F54|nr:nitronate monooxygenase family protein [Mycobacterium sp. PSTR-4-N]MCG7594293.1 nitronate monooxygenase family protein [Mycobacterium sp. PSTR-4-N]